MRLAAAPISWGVCEVPGWGLQLPAARVLADARRLGLGAIEAGPPGFLPADPAAAAALVAEHGLRLVGGFVTAVLHTPVPELEAVRTAARWLRAAGAEVLVLAAASGAPGYERPVELSDEDRRRLFAAMRASRAIANDESLTLAVHPHVGTAIERPQEIELVLAGTDVGLCLDTGHAFIGGADPVDLARAAGARIRHVHLKDVDGQLAEAVRDRRVGYAAAVRRGLYRPLGRGDARIADLTAELVGRGYDGWVVLEQDVALETDAADPSAWVAESLAFLMSRGALAAAVSSDPPFDPRD